MKFLAQFSYITSIIILSSCQSTKTSSIEFSDGSYVGEIDQKGRKNGKGTYTWHDGSVYVGDFKDDSRHGNGRFNWSNGESYKGEYLEDERTGEGSFHWPDGSFYEGSFLRGKRHGSGSYQSVNGAVYEGGWFDDLQHGQGRLNNPNQPVIRGIWKNGKIVTLPAKLPEPASKPIIEKIEIQDLIEIPSDFQQDADTQSTDLISIPSNKVKPVEESDTISTTILLSENQSPEKTLPVEMQPDAIIALPDTVNTVSNQKSLNVWTGTVAEAEKQFITELINGIDTVIDANSNQPFSGKMQILNQNGSLMGEVNLLDGQLHGEETFMSETGVVTEKNIWEKGIRIK
jgi:hypothetical protein